MSRLNTRSLSSDAGLSSPSRRQRQSKSPAPLSSAASGSDKENYSRSSSSRAEKRKSYSMSMPTPEPSTQKRRKLDDRRRSQNTQSLRKKAVENEFDTRYYDPDQDPEERRKTKKGLRNLYAKLNDSTTEYLQSDSNGLVETLTQADKLYKNVKQTTDATIDSRLLVAAADMSYKKIKTLTLGDSSVGVDVDDFVGRCIVFMKRGNNLENNQAPPPSTQRRRRQADDDEEEAGDTMDWDYLGRNASFLYNSRPCLSGFLLGPLSVQKKARQQTQRRAKEAKDAPSRLLRPVELSPEDLEKQESANLSVVCTEIAGLLRRTIVQRRQALEQEYNEYPADEVPEEIVFMMIQKHGLCTDEGLPLLEFCVNPKSFGQTVENLFYVSFLVKESKAGIGFDGDGLPTIHPSEPKSLAERQKTQRNQAIFTMSFDIWEDIVDAMGIKKSIIPHRKEEAYEDGLILDDGQAGPVGNRGAAAFEDEDDDMYG